MRNQHDSKNLRKAADKAQADFNNLYESINCRHSDSMKSLMRTLFFSQYDNIFTKEQRVKIRKALRGNPDKPNINVVPLENIIFFIEHRKNYILSERKTILQSLINELDCSEPEL